MVANYLIKSINKVIPIGDKEYKIFSSPSYFNTDKEDIFYEYLKMLLKVYKPRKVKRIGSKIILDIEDAHKVEILIYEQLCIADVDFIKKDLLKQVKGR